MNKTTKQWRLYTPDLGRIITVSTIDFLESKRGGELDLRIRGAQPQGTPSDPIDQNQIGRPKETLKNVELPPKEKLNNFDIQIPVKINPTESKLGGNLYPMVNQNLYPEQLQSITSNELVKGQIPTDQGLKRPVSLSEEELNTRQSKKLKAFLAKVVKMKPTQISKMDAIEMGYTAAILKEGDIEINVPIPKSYRAVINDPIYGPKWRTAIQEELKSLRVNGTWKEEIPPKGVNLVSTKWVFIVKVKADRTLDRYKAQLIVRGFSQIYGINYFETFTPTTQIDILQIFLAIAATKDQELIHFDIKNVFTESHLKEQIYLSPPQGVKVKDGYVL